MMLVDSNSRGEICCCHEIVMGAVVSFLNAPAGSRGLQKETKSTAQTEPPT